MRNNKIDRLYNALASGELLSEKQIAARFRLKNPRATISSLRMEGYPIYLNSYKTTKGRVKKYRLGTPSRKVIAAGYQTLNAK